MQVIRSKPLRSGEVAAVKSSRWIWIRVSPLALPNDVSLREPHAIDIVVDAEHRAVWRRGPDDSNIG